MDAATPTAPAPVGLRIVRATPDDAETLTELVNEFARFEHLERECRMTPEAASQYLLGPTRSADALIAWLEEAPVGFAVYYRTFSTFAARPGVYLEDLFVRERFRHRGIGRALLGKQVGDSVKLQVPGGAKELEILEFQTMHDLAK